MIYSEEDHFRNKSPRVLKIYQSLLNELRFFGPIRTEYKKAGIYLGHKNNFAEIAVQKNYLLLRFNSTLKLSSPRISVISQVSATNYHHTIKFNYEKEIDSELLSWLKNAYESIK